MGGRLRPANWSSLAGGAASWGTDGVRGTGYLQKRQGSREQGSFLSQIGSWGIDTKGGGGSRSTREGEARKEDKWKLLRTELDTEGVNKGGHRPLPCVCADAMRCDA